MSSIEKTESVKAWAAGFFDGEGSALISQSGPNSYQVTVAVVNTDGRVIDLFSSIWGGYLHTATGEYLLEHSNARARKTGYKLYFKYDEARVLLTDLLPYLVIKKEEAAIVLIALSVLPELPEGKKKHAHGTTILLKPYSEATKQMRRVVHIPQLMAKRVCDIIPS